MAHMCARAYEERVCQERSIEGGMGHYPKDDWKKERQEGCTYRELRRWERAYVNKPERVKVMCTFSLGVLVSFCQPCIKGPSFTG